MLSLNAFHGMAPEESKILCNDINHTLSTCVDCAAHFCKVDHGSLGEVHAYIPFFEEEQFEPPNRVSALRNGVAPSCLSSILQ